MALQQHLECGETCDAVPYGQGSGEDVLFGRFDSMPLDDFLAEYESLMAGADATEGLSSAGTTPASTACNNYFESLHASQMQHADLPALLPELPAQPADTDCTEQRTTSTQSQHSKVMVELGSISSPDFGAVGHRASNVPSSGGAVNGQRRRRTAQRRKGKRGNRGPRMPCAAVSLMAPTSLSGLLLPFGFVKKYAVQGGVNLEQVNAMIMALEEPARLEP